MSATITDKDAAAALVNVVGDTGTAGEINVHLSIKEDTTQWPEVAKRITEKGITDVIAAVNRRVTEVVYDPEI